MLSSNCSLKASSSAIILGNLANHADSEIKENHLITKKGFNGNNPLFIDDILIKIFQFCDQNALSEITLVCDFWKTIYEEQYREVVEIRRSINNFLQTERNTVSPRCWLDLYQITRSTLVRSFCCVVGLSGLFAPIIYLLISGAWENQHKYKDDLKELNSTVLNGTRCLAYFNEDDIFNGLNCSFIFNMIPQLCIDLCDTYLYDKKNSYPPPDYFYFIGLAYFFLVSAALQVGIGSCCDTDHNYNSCPCSDCIVSPKEVDTIPIYRFSAPVISAANHMLATDNKGFRHEIYGEMGDIRRKAKQRLDDIRRNGLKTFMYQQPKLVNKGQKNQSEEKAVNNTVITIKKSAAFPNKTSTKAINASSSISLSASKRYTNLGSIPSTFSTPLLEIKEADAVNMDNLNSRIKKPRQ